VVNFLDSVLSVSNPDATRVGRQEVLVVDALLLAVDRLDAGEFGDDPDVRSAIQPSMARALLGHGRAQEALRLAEEALSTIGTLWPTDDAAMANAHHLVGYCLTSKGRFNDAVAHYQQALERVRRLFPGDHPRVGGALNNLGHCLTQAGRFDEGLPMLEESLAMARRLTPGDSANTAKTLTNLAGCYGRAGRPAEALALHVEAVDMRRRVYEGDHPDLAVGVYNLGESLARSGRLEEALEQHTAALEMRRRLYSGDHESLLNSIGRVGALLSTLGRHEQALPLLEEALGMDQRIQLLLPTHRASLLASLGLELVATGEPKNLRRAEQYLREVVAIRHAVSPDHWNLQNARSILAEAIYLIAERDKALDTQERVARCHESEALLLDAYEGLVARRHAIDPLTTRLLSPVAQCERRIAHLYATWDSLEPGKGHDATAREWR